jgi:hypothetical protein
VHRGPAFVVAAPAILGHLRRCPPDRIGAGVLEQAAAQQHRHQMDIKLVDQASSQALTSCLAAHDGHVAVTGCRFRVP